MSSPTSAANASDFVQVPLSQEPRREALRSTPTLGAGAPVDRALRVESRNCESPSRGQGAVLPQRYTRGSDLAIVVGFYALAKVLETFDTPIFAAGRIVSGHTLKHLAAAAAGYCILRMLQSADPSCFCRQLFRCSGVKT